MHIASFRIENYKSFRATAVVNLTPGFNVVVGQNNVGKTALVEALSLTAGNKVHRSLKSLPTPTSPLEGASLVDASFALKRTEIIDLLRSIQPLWVPNPEGTSPNDTLERLKRALQDDVQSLRCTCQNNAVTSARLESFEAFPQVNRCAQLRIVDADGNL